MAVKGVIFDISGTLVDVPSGRAVDGAIAVIERLQTLGIEVVAFANESRMWAERTLANAGIPISGSWVFSHDDVGVNKGSPKWIDAVTMRTGLHPNELLYVGNSTLDMATASHARVFYLRADWTTTDDKKYGFPAPSLNWVRIVVEHIFRKKHLWYWELNDSDDLGRMVRKMALCKIDADSQVKARLIDVFKSGHTTLMLGQMSVRDFVMLHLAASVYATGLDAKSVLWTTYPGSKVGQSNEVMGEFLDVAAKLFRGSYEPALILRHRDALNSREAYKSSGGSMAQAMENQLDSVYLNPQFRTKLKGKSVLVFDNFITRGPSTEVPRNLLLGAGVSEVTAIGIGKYNYPTAVITPPVGSNWYPFGAIHPLVSDFHTREARGTYNEDAYTEFVRSMDAVSKEQ